MSMSMLVRIASYAGQRVFDVGLLVLVASCSDGAPRVSYAGLDRAFEPDELPPVVVGVVVDATGPGAAGGRDFADALRAAFAAPGGAGTGTGFRVHVLDDRGTEAGVHGAAERLEVDPAVHVAIVAPGLGRAAAAAQLAPRTVVVCAGCDAADAAREGVFVLAGPGDAATATAGWIRSAMRDDPSWNPRVLAGKLRTTDPPLGFARSEGSAPAVDPYLFRDPPARASRP